MRLVCILLATIVIFLARCNAANIDRTKLSKVISPNPIQASGFAQSNGNENRFLRTSEAIDDGNHAMNDKERGIKSLLRNIQVNCNTKLLEQDFFIKSNLKKIKQWYKNGDDPERVWKELHLGSLQRNFFDQGKFERLKMNLDYQMYLYYETFYKIVKGQMPKTCKR